jgi:PKD repeat protein
VTRPGSGSATPLLAVLASLAACSSSSPAHPAHDAGQLDAPSDAVAANALDIAVTGCGSFDVASGVESCSGPAPFTVRFSPVGAPGLTTFVWDFGDGTPQSSDVAPVHTYTLPGRYSVSVKAGSPAVGTIPAMRPGLINALVIPAGGACDVQVQCARGLDCICKAGSGCGAAFARGICSQPCPTGFCGMQSVCAIYSLPTGAQPDASDAGTDWSSLCLADCSGGNACAPGFVCQSFHAGGNGAAGWVQGCLPVGAAGDLGASCRTADGVLDHTRCASGYCSPIAANGFCSASCQLPLTCPDGTACARLTAGQLCVPSCAGDRPCSGDPTVACQAPTAADAGAGSGLPIVTGDFTQTYCASIEPGP